MNHSITLVVNNAVGVLNRVTNIIRKKNYNIATLKLETNSSEQATIYLEFYDNVSDIESLALLLEKLYDVNQITLGN